MKKYVYSFAIVAVAGATFFNFGSNNLKAANNNLKSKNITLVQASAGEIWCDATSSAICRIGPAEGTGALHQKD